MTTDNVRKFRLRFPRRPEVREARAREHRRDALQKTFPESNETSPANDSRFVRFIFRSGATPQEVYEGLKRLVEQHKKD